MSHVTNSNAAFGQSDGVNQHYNTAYPFLNGGSADIAAGDVVTLNATITASQRLEVKQADVGSDDDATVLGVAYEAIPAGDTGLVVVHGYAVVNVGDSSSISAGQLATMHASTDGAAANVTGTGATVQGDYFGTFLGAEDLLGTNQAPVWVSKQ